MFRGVGFFIDSSEFTTGRDHALHAFPQRDTQYVEDIGRKPRRWRVRGYLIGDDYLDQKDRLIAACERRPVGWPFKADQTLQHPYFGVLAVHCESLRITETRRQGRIATFVAVFVQTDEVEGPRETVNAAAVADGAATELGAVSGPVVEEGLVATGLGVAERVRAATTATLELVGQALDSLSTIRGAVLEVQAFKSRVAGLIQQAAVLATSPVDLVTSVRDAVDSIFDAAGNFGDSLFAYEELLGLDSSGLLEGGTGTTSTTANANVGLVSQLTLEAAAAGALRSIARVEFESLEEAIDRRDSLAELLDRVLLSAPYETYGQLLELSARLVELVPPDGQALPRLLELRLSRTEPSLVVAHRLYGDASRATELAERNQIERPGFVPGGRVLQVLSE